MSRKSIYIFFGIFFLLTFQNTIYSKEIIKPLSMLLEVKYDEKNSVLEVIKMQLSKKPSPKIRNLNVEPGQILCQIEDNNGNILFTAPVKDPTILYSDWPSKLDDNGGHIEGQIIENTNSSFMLAVPYVPSISKIKVSKPKFNSKGKVESYSVLSTFITK